MYLAYALIKGASALSHSQFTNIEHIAPMMEKESHDAYDRRVWRHKAHADADGRLYHPAMGLKQSIDAAARYANERIGEKGRQTWSKKISSAVNIFGQQCWLVDANKKALMLKDCEIELVHANADGRRGSGSRVWRRFPMISAGWFINTEWTVMDDQIPPSILKRYIEFAGMYIGIGRFRPEKSGFLGRFTVEKFDSKQVSAGA